MRRLIHALVAATLIGAGCGGEPLQAIDHVRRAIRETEAQPRGFVYQDEDPRRDVMVHGVLHDDYRYKARLSVDGLDSLEEVGVDDALAVRFLHPNALEQVTAATGPPQAQASPDLDVLRTGRWLVDPSGAPEITSPVLLNRPIGTDPVLEALTAFSYVERAMRESQTVVRFNPEAIDYEAKEDKFPKPEKGSPVVRYDLRAPAIPPLNAAAGALADVRHFRRMSIYVKGGAVIQVLEEIDVAARYDRLVAAMNVKIPSQLRGGQRLAFALEALNRIRASRGIHPIRIRRMSFEIVDLGKRPSSQLPSDGVVQELRALPNRGRAATSAAADR